MSSGLGEKGVVVVLGELHDPCLDAVGEAVRREDAVGGVDLEPVVLRWVVAAGEDHAGGGAALGHRRGEHRRRHIPGHQLDRHIFRRDEFGRRAGELLGQHAGVVADDDRDRHRRGLHEGCR